MLSYADEVVHAHLRERRSQLLAEAAAYRLVREQRRQPAPAGRGLRSAPLDRWLAAVGARLVMWGEGLQAHARRRQAQAQEIVRA